MTQLRQLKGLTWDHPRGYGPLDSANWQRFGLEINWSRQPLSGFESRSIEDIATKYDLLVLDHPSMGEVAATGALRPINELFDSRTLDSWSIAAIGNTFSSYTVGENQWALPIDAAAQVFVSNRKNLPPPDHPKTWRDVLHLADRLPYALSVGGPHAFCTFFSIAVSVYRQAHGVSYDRNFLDGILNHCVGEDALELLKELFAKSDTSFRQLNPIELLQELRSGTAISFCPLVFAYVDYERGQTQTPLAFGEAPSPDNTPTSILGGAGLALSRNAELSVELSAAVSHVMSSEFQAEHAPLFGGQPALEAAWSSDQINDASGQFFSSTIETMRNAAIRPRCIGIVEYQSWASQRIKQFLDADEDVKTVLRDLAHRFRQLSDGI